MPKKPVGAPKLPLGPAGAVLLAVLAVSIPMGRWLIAAERRGMVEELVQRVDTLLAVLSSSAADNLSPNLESVRLLNAMRAQVAAAMPEARYFTLTGYGLDDPGRFDYLWASSDPYVNQKVADRQFAAANYGRVRLYDEIAPEVDRLAAEVNAAAARRVAAMAGEADRLGAEARRLAFKADADSRARIRELDVEIYDLSARINSELQELRGKGRSFPPLDPRRLPRQLEPFYLFYLPVVYRQRGEDVYFRGAVRLGISTARLSAELTGSRRRLLIRAGLIALAAAGLGLAVVFAAAGIVVAAPAAPRRKGGRLSVRKEEKA